MRGGKREGAGRKAGSKNKTYTDKTITFYRKVTEEEFNKLNEFLKELREE